MLVNQRPSARLVAAIVLTSPTRKSTPQRSSRAVTPVISTVRGTSPLMTSSTAMRLTVGPFGSGDTMDTTRPENTAISGPLDQTVQGRIGVRARARMNRQGLDGQGRAHHSRALGHAGRPTGHRAVTGA